MTLDLDLAGAAGRERGQEQHDACRRDDAPASTAGASS
jgi:hypothetical protein